MPHYRFTSLQPRLHFVEIEMEAEVQAGELRLQLPAWRPGRYELGNFARNVRSFRVHDGQGKPLPFRKMTKDCWQVEVPVATQLKVAYQYYAADLNAGSTYVDAQQLYVNPVNCCLYIEGRMGEDCTVELLLPPAYRVATGMEVVQLEEMAGQTRILLRAGGFHELADSPFIASASLQHHTFRLEETLFHIWIQGECRPDWDRIITDFKAFSAAQVEAFGEFPTKEYHFLLQVLPFTFYHGVEHLTSSVNALGPGYDLMGGRYIDLLGLCSHELYHAWNIKSIRPAEMWPYDYTRENYFRTGYVAEGVTTYMGDYFLLASGVFTVDQYLDELSQQVQKHLDNFGRHNYSVAESSFDTWLDGYVPGVPGRKVSIYTEGCLLAFMTDVLLFNYSEGRYRLHDVMRTLYSEYAQQGRGYTEQDYQHLIEKYAGKDFTQFFKRYVNGTESYLPLLEECLSYLGMELKSLPTTPVADRHYGFRLSETVQQSTVTAVYPGSGAALSGLLPGDQVQAVNGYALRGDAGRWIQYFSGQSLKLIVTRSGELAELEIAFSETPYFLQHRVVLTERSARFEQWASRYTSFT